MKLLWTTALACLSAILLTSNAAAATCGTRVRRNWDSMSTADQDLYKRAIASAMDSGAYIKFVEIHTEMMSEREAHRQCMFIYWHRLLVVTFENMLRAQGNEFACVTLPYWDWITGYNRQANSQCFGISTCNAIPNGLGGVPSSSKQKTLAINTISTSGACVSSYPLSHFCQASGITGSSCAGCITRGAWNSTTLPASTSYASVRNQLFSATNIGEMSPNIEQGCHNNVHANLDGAIATFTSPGDPLFWSHHAMVDLLHVIFHKCKVGTTKMTYEEKATHLVAWTSCERRNDGGPFNPSDVITMRTGKYNTNSPVDAVSDTLIGKFFPNIQRRFADMMDVRDLGDSSYAYEVSGYLATMYNACDGTAASNSSATTTTMPDTTSTPTTTTATPTTTTAAPVSTTATPVTTTATPKTTTATPTSTTVKPTTTTATPTKTPKATTAAPTPAPTAAFGGWWSNWWNWWFGGRHGRRRLTENPSAYDSGSDVEGTVETADYSDSSDVTQDAYGAGSDTASISASSSSTGSLVDDAQESKSAAYESVSGSASSSDVGEIEHAVVILTEEESDESTALMMLWYEKMVELYGGDSQNTRDEIERMGCTFQSECLGGVHEYSDAFKTLWGAQSPRCKLIMDDLNNGDAQISADEWRRPIGKLFGCPVPSDDSVVDAYVTDSTGSSSPTQQTTKAPKTACPM